MGDIYTREGYFHIESRINPGLKPLTLKEAHAFTELLKGFSVICRVELVFWAINPRGFGIIVKKTAETNFSLEEKFKALERIGEEKLALRWAAQSKEGVKPLKEYHLAKLKNYENSSNDLGAFTKGFKQRMSSAYNKTHHSVGSIWRERAKAFHLPNDHESLIEVAAFILAQSIIDGNRPLQEIPSTLQDAAVGNKTARDGLRALFQASTSTAQLIKRLEKLTEKMVDQMAHRIPTVGRGRSSAWRPHCERDI